MAGPDIFISYSHATHDVAERLAHLFEEAGHDVWWDRELGAGSRFRAEIEQNLSTARVVIVIWSESAVESDWVLGEAASARDRGVLVPVKVDACKLPIEFRQIHTVDLSGWLKSGKPHALEKLFDDIGVRLDPDYVPQPRQKRFLLAWQASRRRKAMLYMAGLAAVGLSAVLLQQPTAVSESVCRGLGLCLSATPRIVEIDPIAEKLATVVLHRSVDGPAVYVSDRGTMFARPGTTALFYAADTPHIGDYVPTGVAGEDLITRSAGELAQLPADTLMAVLDGFPDLADMDAVREAMVSQLDTRVSVRSCADVSDSAKRLVLKRRLGGDTDKTNVLRARLAARALACSPDVFPPDW